MERPNQTSLVLIGIPSMFLIFSVLAMLILALLTYGTTRSDIAENRQAFQQTTSYYDACTQATAVYEELLPQVTALASKASSSVDLIRQISTISPSDDAAVWNSETEQWELLLPFSGSQSLSVSFRPDYDHATLRIASWNTVLTEDWTPDSTLHLYTPDR